ncbi:hypothetical protein BSMD_015960 [Bacillus subtilis Miyagi-4]|nr:hypothetical protein BSMD_015960 [Bacillus subtilis Miyagi-4]
MTISCLFCFEKTVIPWLSQNDCNKKSLPAHPVNGVGKL